MNERILRNLRRIMLIVQGLEITPASVGKERTVEPNVEISLDRFPTFS